MPDLPKLLYLGNPPVLNTIGGSGLLYRILENYPTEKLALTWSTGQAHSTEPGRLPNALHRLIEAPQWLVRARSHRLATLFTMSYSIMASYWAKRVLNNLGSFKPEAVLSVTHGFFWDTSVRLSEMLNVPLHLIHHDHWSVTVPVPARLRSWAGHRWAKACRKADSNFCVSDGMMDEVAATLALNQTLLLPTSSSGLFDHSPSIQRSASGTSLVFGYAGTVQTPGHLEVVKRFAKIITKRGHTMRLFGPYDEAFWKTNLGTYYRDGMWAGFVQGHDVPMALNQQTDALLLPLSFNPSDANNMRVSFPCKICDYCASGRPIIAWMPPISSAGRWAQKHPKAILHHDQFNDDKIITFVDQLISPSVRSELGERCFNLGKECFSVEAGHKILINQLLSVQTKVTTEVTKT